MDGASESLVGIVPNPFNDGASRHVESAGDPAVGTCEPAESVAGSRVNDAKAVGTGSEAVCDHGWIECIS